MSFDTRLLDIVCCPVTHLPLRLMNEAELKRLNERIESGTVQAADSTPVTEPLAEALMTDDGRLAYPIRDDIPLLIEEHSIVVAEHDEP